MAAVKRKNQAMAAVKRRKKSQVRQRNKTQSRRGKSTRRRTTGKRVNRNHGKKRSAGKNSRKIRNLQLDSVRMTNEAQNILHFCVHDLYKKVSLAAERLRKKKRHVSITVSDVKNALKKIMPRKSDGKPISSISYKCH